MLMKLWKVMMLPRCPHLWTAACHSPPRCRARSSSTSTCRASVWAAARAEPPESAPQGPRWACPEGADASLKCWQPWKFCRQLSSPMSRFGETWERVAILYRRAGSPGRSREGKPYRPSKGVRRAKAKHRMLYAMLRDKSSRERYRIYSRDNTSSQLHARTH